MNFHDLNIFVSAARLGSVTGAAKALGTVQPNVTMRIRILEEELGVQLFRRNPRGIELTTGGQEFLPFAKNILALLQEARDKVSGRHRVPCGVLRIGSVHSTAAVRLPGILRDYAAKYSAVDIAVETGMAPELIGKVLDGRIEGAFVSGQVDRPELDVIPAFNEEVVMVTPAVFRTVKSYLKHGPVPKVLVFPLGCFYRQKLSHFLFDEGFTQLEEMQFGTFEGIIGCVSAGLGITMLPRSVVEGCALRNEVQIHALPREISQVGTSFIVRKTEIHSAALDGLVELIAEKRRSASKI